MTGPVAEAIGRLGDAKGQVAQIIQTLALAMQLTDDVLSIFQAVMAGVPYAGGDQLAAATLQLMTMTEEAMNQAGHIEGECDTVIGQLANLGGT